MLFSHRQLDRLPLPHAGEEAVRAVLTARSIGSLSRMRERKQSVLFSPPAPSLPSPGGEGQGEGSRPHRRLTFIRRLHVQHIQRQRGSSQ